jgi:deazaflavin-dependent oxidoreductase (nitroreductase family)
VDTPRKARLVRLFQKYALNPPARLLAGLGVTPGQAILETVGRRSGQPRRVPISNGLRDGTFWIVAEHGRRADYVRNIEANPRVRVRVGRRWHTGVAHLLPDDDPRRHIGVDIRGLNAAMIRAVGTDLLTIRVDLTD